jgi:hypothetical protein
LLSSSGVRQGDGDSRARRRARLLGRRRSSASSRRILAALGCAVALGAVAPAAAFALPTISTKAVTTPLANFGAHRGVTVSAACAAGSRLVGGGGYLRNATDPTILPTNGLVLGAVAPSTGASPVDLAVADGAVDPATWFGIANFTGVSEGGDQASTFALCASSGGPSHTVVAVASRVGANPAQEVSPTASATATCPAGTRLIGGGATTSTPDQVNDGTTVGNNGNLKPLGSYPSNAVGVAAANGSTSATSWSAFGSAGVTSAGDTVTAYALCSSDPATPPVQVVRTDVDGPDAQVGTTTIAASATCPATTRMLGGGYSVDETVSGVGGLQPQQGFHMRGSYPTTPGTPPIAVGDGTANPDTWSALGQAGGQNLSAGKHMTERAFAMCATAPPTPPVPVTGAASAITNTGATLSGTVNPSGSPATYTFEYGTTTSFGANTPFQSAGSGAVDVPVSAMLTGLAPDTTYLYRIVVKDGAGNGYFGAVLSFDTGPGGAPIAATGAASSVTSSGATLAGTLDPHGAATAFTFEYGTSLSFGSISAVDSAGGGNGARSVSLPVSGLAPNTTYYYRLVAANTSGTTSAAVASFTTGPGAAPVAVTGAASSFGPGGAVLSGTINPGGRDTAFTFEYGTSLSFGSITAVDSLLAQGAVSSVSLPVGGLAPSTTYYYRLVATNALGTATGAISSFTTSAAGV